MAGFRGERGGGSWWRIGIWLCFSHLVAARFVGFVCICSLQGWDGWEGISIGNCYKKKFRKVLLLPGMIAMVGGGVAFNVFFDAGRTWLVSSVAFLFRAIKVSFVCVKKTKKSFITLIFCCCINPWEPLRPKTGRLLFGYSMRRTFFLLNKWTTYFASFRATPSTLNSNSEWAHGEFL